MPLWKWQKVQELLSAEELTQAHAWKELSLWCGSQ